MEINIINKNMAQCMLDEQEMIDYDLTIDEIKNGMNNKEHMHSISERILNVIDDMNDTLIMNGQPPFEIENSLLSMSAEVKNQKLLLTIRAIHMSTNNQNIDLEEKSFDDFEEMVENDEELPQMPSFLENLFKSILGLPIDSNNYDRTNNLENISSPNSINKTQEVSNKKNNKIINSKNKIDLNQDYKILRFSNLTNVCRFCSLLIEKDIKDSSLYKLDKNDYVLIFKISKNELEEQKINHIIYEFYMESNTNNKIPSIPYIKEHYIAIIERDAITKLAKL